MTNGGRRVLLAPGEVVEQVVLEQCAGPRVGDAVTAPGVRDQPVSDPSRPRASGEPSVAVVITTYEHARFVEGAVRSVLAQTVPVDEIIVVDDGSSDRPQDVVAGFPQVRIVSQPNRGLAAARNVGWRTARSDLVLFLDADDRLVPIAVEANRRALAAAPEAALAYGAYVLVDVASARIKQPEQFPLATYERLLERNVIGMHGAVLYRRAALEAIGGFDERLRACEDWDVYLRLARHSPLARTPHVVAQYWRHDSNMSGDPATMVAAAQTVLRGQAGDAGALGLGARLRRSARASGADHCAEWWYRVVGAAVRRQPVRPVLARGPALARVAPVSFLLAPWRVGAREYRRFEARSRRVAPEGQG